MTAIASVHRIDEAEAVLAEPFVKLILTETRRTPATL